MREIYMDNSATTKIKNEVFEEMKPFFMENYGNASSIYKIGRVSKKAVEDAREIIAKAINAEPREIYFTSGGTEANNIILKGVADKYADKGKHIITSTIEHPAVLNSCKSLEKEGYEVSYIKVDSDGIIDMDQLKNEIREDTILISIMFANNEIGTIQPVKEIGKMAKEKNIYFHTDAVQAFGSEYIDVEELGIDLLSLSAHKIYGPKGIGAVYIKKGIKVKTLIDGGAQEKGIRPGTENVPSIVGFGKAAEIAMSSIDEHRNKLISLRDSLIGKITNNVKYIKLNGHPKKRLPGNVNISFEFVEGESLLLSLDMKGISASSGSACTSGSLDPSHVLLEIGLKHEIAHGSLRLTLGDFNSEDELDYVVESIKEIVTRLREMSPLYEKVKEAK